MKEFLNIALIQAPLVWENAVANRSYFSKKILAISEDVAVFILPEMFTTGFTMNAKPLAETFQGETTSWMLQLAQKKQAAITGSIIIEENGKFYNRLLFVYPSGKITTYDKKHLFTLATENEVYTAGKTKPIIDFQGWKICPLICYDLRFPVWARNKENYDILIYVANWPEMRIAAWDTLLQARAIENMAYCVGVNRVGTDGNGYKYVGHSAVYDALGKKVSQDLNEKEGITIVCIKKSHLEETRNKLKFLEDMDTFQI
ncbi:MAG: amidohydrolase [Flavobacteriaceae bacterium CG_4_8_14_3_um_filter_34_10]|nr:amidohydrolase [Flavobacteriia bacterium]OIP51334.1 MAG: nitrilase family protein [Flavobacteriaceae bacterium CG2_30_34_30]PIQ17848.1 MAG: amidohydrolase [Flavobacteriaceae bacterium CG18_big_fil_WC_8_21_14_2_50_34_36]PIV51251.1 MAG: amidohydrolase [Flavobacteriaceae bacterium CG02_land_8_20_14_3_00_34_13]PIX08375.1 MAG: amidohydrolase [Flavobacteriaceae bacterium CG_4_8_14_3_um_filter_34_10]PIZ07503.1 MAG: amidohydrolase [Flavobacteriaceae bacterium CG_4_10_14_0_8_um_filter_34_31]PJC0729